MKIISGGQTGADQAALRTARELGLPTGGHAPAGWKTDIGPAPWLEEYGLVEAETDEFPVRTILNVKNGDATLLFGDMKSPGCKLTLGYCQRLSKPYNIVHWPRGGWDWDAECERVRRWLSDQRVQVLNVAGNRERTNPGITRTVSMFLMRVLRTAP